MVGTGLLFLNPRFDQPNHEELEKQEDEFGTWHFFVTSNWDGENVTPLKG